MKQHTDPDTIDARVRELLAYVLEMDTADMMDLPNSTPLFGDGLTLDSLTGLQLLAGVEEQFGIDIAAEDLNLDSLETIGTLIDYLSSGQSDRSQISL